MKKLTALCLAAALLFGTGANAFAAARVAVIMYHEISSDESRHSDWCVSPEMLESDISYFTERGYVTLTASELADASMESIDGKSILLLTFDDGYECWYTDVYPILRRAGAKATMFVVGAYINRYGYLSEDQIREMADSGLIEIGSHTDMVHQMPREALINLYGSDGAWDVITDIKSSAERLSRITGKEVTSLAWPYGYSTETLDYRVKNELGIKMTFSTNFGVNYYYGDNSVLFNRINRDLNETSEELYLLAENKF